MPLPVSLKDVAGQMDGFPDEWALYIDRKTGEIVPIPDETSGLRDEEEAQEDIARVEGSEDFVALPGKYEIHEYAIMERFCRSRDDERTSESLLRAIRGKGAFRYFKDKIWELGIREEWFAYKERAIAEIAADFLEAEGIAFIDDIGLQREASSDP